MASQVCPARFATSSTGSVPPPSVRPLASPASRPPQSPCSMSTLVSAVFRDLLRDRLRGIAELTDEQAAALESHYNLLVLWNRTLNLTTIRDLPEVIERHYGESLFLAARLPAGPLRIVDVRSEEHTSELQSHRHLVCRLLLEKKYQFFRDCVCACWDLLEENLLSPRVWR